MGEGNQIKAKIFVPSQKDKDRGRPSRMLTFDMISDWIRLQGFDEYTTNGLIELAARYPTNALPSFRRNFNLMIARVRQKRREEQNNKPESSNNEEASESQVQGSPAAGEHPESGS